tara:strand:- start:4844 stop:6373 length:1530 start_codon:yes stop_codon:yes gene_type:complete
MNAVSILHQAHKASTAYQSYQLRLCLALSWARLIPANQISKLSISDAISFLSSDLGFSFNLGLRCDVQFITKCLSPFLCDKTFKNRYPLISFYIRRMLDQHSMKDVKSALLAHPTCEFLYQELCSPHSPYYSFSSRIRKRYTDLFCWSRRSIQYDHLYFSPLLQISVGHYFHLINTIKLSRIHFSSALPITVFVDNLDSNSSLFHTLQDTELSRIHVRHHDSILESSLCHAESLLNSDYYLAPISASYENELQSQLDLISRNNFKRNTVYMHLRTSAYKNDGHSPFAVVRNVEPSTYNGLIKVLRSETDVEPVLVTADPVLPAHTLVKTLHVVDRESESRQWMLVRDSCFSVGTASGLSHLFNLGIGHTLRTNSNGLALDDFFTTRHLVACKRFEIMDRNLIPSNIEDLLHLICLPWEINNGLASIAFIRDLSDHELVCALREFLDIYNNFGKPSTLYDVLIPFGLKSLTECIPNRNITKFTAIDIKKALLNYSLSPQIKNSIHDRSIY